MGPLGTGDLRQLSDTPGITAQSGRSRGLPAIRALVAVAALSATGLLAGCSNGPSADRSTPTIAGPGPSQAAGSTVGRPVDPCSLVSRHEAESILHQSLSAKEAPLGPTCIFTDKAKTVVATVAVQSGSVGQIRGHMSQVQVTTSGTHQLVCGIYGTTMVVASIRGGSILEIAAPCPAAQRMAADALAKLD